MAVAASAVLVVGVLVAAVAHVRARAEVRRMDAVAASLRVPAGWQEVDRNRTAPPLGLCAASVQACPSTHVTWVTARPPRSVTELEHLLPDAEWTVEESGCTPPADVSGSWTSCAARTRVDGFTAHASVSGATFDDEVRIAVDISPNRS